MAKLPQRFLDIDAALLPYGGTGATLADILAAINAGNTLAGMWLTYKSSEFVTVRPGSVSIAGAAVVLDAPVDVSIYDDFGDAGSPLSNTIYYLYAANENGTLVFYFSASAPVTQHSESVTAQPQYRYTALQHPQHELWRYIGQVLYCTNATLLPFTVCTPTYWEGAWVSATRNVDMTLEHAWGAVPQDVGFMFSTTTTNSTNVLTTLTYAALATKRYGVLPRVISNKTIGLDVQKDALFWDNNTASWVNSGYIKAIVRR